MPNIQTFIYWLKNTWIYKLKYITPINRLFMWIATVTPVKVDPVLYLYSPKLSKAVDGVNMNESEYQWRHCKSNKMVYDCANGWVSVTKIIAAEWLHFPCCQKAWSCQKDTHALGGWSDCAQVLKYLLKSLVFAKH